MNSHRSLAESTQHNLTVVCYGRAELPEDYSVFATYRTRTAITLGVCARLDSAITLAEHSVALPPRTLRRLATALAFAPERIIIRDSKARLVLAGEITRTYLVWFPPITSDDEIYTIRARAERLREDASREHGWDNFSTADSLERRAEFLEDHLVDPFWQTEVTNTLKQHAKAFCGLARTHLPVANACINDSDYDPDSDSDYDFYSQYDFD